MDRENLWYQIVLQLPLNVIWRLPGWSRMLNRVLMRELLWRQKCEMECPVIHRVVPNYRLYYLMRSTNGYGRLYVNGALDPCFKRVWAVIAIYNTEKSVYRHAVLDGTTLYFTHGPSGFDSIEHTEYGVDYLTRKLPARSRGADFP